MEDRQVDGQAPKDTGLRRMLIWTFAALIAALIIALVAVTLVFHWWGSGP